MALGKLTCNMVFLLWRGCGLSAGFQTSGIVVAIDTFSVVVRSFDCEVLNDKLFLKYVRWSVNDLPNDAIAWWSVLWNCWFES